MDANLKKLLDELPDKPPRSRLEPYREFIEELRTKGRTYRNIAEILAEKCGVQVTGSGVHDFVRSRSRMKMSQAQISPTKTNQVGPTTQLAADTCAGSAIQRGSAAQDRGTQSA